MNARSAWLARIALGAAGGFAGTLVIQALLAAGKKYAPGTIPPLRQEPGAFMTKKVEAALPGAVRESIPAAVEAAAPRLLGAGYGVTFGALYAAVRPDGGSPWRDGAVLGVACWAAGYLGWLPALGLMPPLWRQTAAQVAGPVVEHVAYGVTTVAVYDWLHDRLAA
jgi:hypothetical protein